MKNSIILKSAKVIAGTQCVNLNKYTTWRKQLIENTHIDNLDQVMSAHSEYLLFLFFSGGEHLVLLPSCSLSLSLFPFSHTFFLACSYFMFLLLRSSLILLAVTV